MIPSIEHTSLLPILFWLLMLPIAVFILIRTTAFWTEEGPGTIVAAVKTVFAIWLTVFFVYDLSGYGFARVMQDPRLGIAFPPNYSYWSWLREPMGLKGFVLGTVPLIRYLPVLFALCAGGVVQVLLWKIPFRVGMLVFLSQLFLTIFAMAVLSLVFTFFVGVEKGVDGKVPRRVAAGAAAGCGWALPACLVLRAQATGHGRPLLAGYLRVSSEQSGCRELSPRAGYLSPHYDVPARPRRSSAGSVAMTRSMPI